MRVLAILPTGGLGPGDWTALRAALKACGVTAVPAAKLFVLLIAPFLVSRAAVLKGVADSIEEVAQPCRARSREAVSCHTEHVDGILSTSILRCRDRYAQAIRLHTLTEKTVDRVVDELTANEKALLAHHALLDHKRTDSMDVHHSALVVSAAEIVVAASMFTKMSLPALSPVIPNSVSTGRVLTDGIHSAKGHFLASVCTPSPSAPMSPR